MYSELALIDLRHRETIITYTVSLLYLVVDFTIDGIAIIEFDEIHENAVWPM